MKTRKQTWDLLIKYKAVSGPMPEGRWDLSYVDLSRADLSYAELSYAELSYASLDHADLSHADLNGADLVGSSLYGANLSYADLSCTRLEYSDLSYADLSHAKITDSVVIGADLSYANLIGADLTDADLGNAELSYADLSHADLTGANLWKARIDFSSWPLWCESLQVRGRDDRQAQILYHILSVLSVENLALTPQVLIDFANTFHRVKDGICREIKKKMKSPDREIAVREKEREQARLEVQEEAEYLLWIYRNSGAIK